MNIHYIIRNSTIYFASTITPEEQEFITEKLAGITRGGRVHSLTGYPQFISVSLGYAYRVILDLVNYKEERVFRVIGVLPEHEYDEKLKVFDRLSRYEEVGEKTTFVNLGISNKNTPTETPEKSMLPSQDKLRRHNKFANIVILTQEQDKHLDRIRDDTRDVPIFVNGIAGSGKTLLANLYLQEVFFGEDQQVDLPLEESEAINHHNTYVYVCRTRHLAQAQQAAFDDETKNADTSTKAPSSLTPTIKFKSVEDLFKELKLIDTNSILEDFEKFYNYINWINRHDKSPSQVLKQAIKSLQEKFSDKQIYHEIKNIILRKVSKNEYFAFTFSETIADKEILKENFFSLSCSYLSHCQSKGYIFLENIDINQDNLNEHQFTQIILDEVQDSFSIIGCLSKLSQRPLIMFGDFNQGQIYFNQHIFYSILQECYPEKHLEIIKLTTNFRCSTTIIEAANQLLNISLTIMEGNFNKNSINKLTAPKQSTSSPTSKVELTCKDHTEFLQDLPEEVFCSTLFVVDTQGDLIKYQKDYPKALILSVDNIGGLEFNKVVYLPNNHSQILLESLNRLLIKKNYSPESLESPSSSNRPKNKEMAQINLPHLQQLRQLFLIFTRASESANMVCKKNIPFLKEILEKYNSTDVVEHTQQLDKISEMEILISNICQVAQYDKSQAIRHFIENVLNADKAQHEYLYNIIEKNPEVFKFTPELLNIFAEKYRQKEVFSKWVNSMLQVPDASCSSTPTASTCSQSSNTIIHPSYKDGCIAALKSYVENLNKNGEILLAKIEKDRFEKAINDLELTLSEDLRANKLEEIKKQINYLTNNLKSGNNPETINDELIKERIKIFKAINNKTKKNITTLVDKYCALITKYKDNEEVNINQHLACFWHTLSINDSNKAPLIVHLFKHIYKDEQCKITFFQEYIHINNINNESIFLHLCSFLIKKKDVFITTIQNFDHKGAVNLVTAFANRNEYNEKKYFIDDFLLSIDIFSINFINKILTHQSSLIKFLTTRYKINNLNWTGFKHIANLHPEIFPTIIQKLAQEAKTLVTKHLIIHNNDGCTIFHILASKKSIGSINAILSILDEDSLINFVTALKMIPSIPKHDYPAIAIIAFMVPEVFIPIMNKVISHKPSLINLLSAKRDKNNLNVFDYIANAYPTSLSAIIEVLGDEAKALFAKNLITKYDKGRTILHILAHEKSIDSITAILKLFDGDDLEYFVHALKITDEAHNLAITKIRIYTPEVFISIIDKVISHKPSLISFLSTTYESNRTLFHCVAADYPDSLPRIIKILGKNETITLADKYLTIGEKSGSSMLQQIIPYCEWVNSRNGEVLGGDKSNNEPMVLSKIRP